jgi:hypothetical protein
VFALKEAVGADEIRQREERFARRALASWSENPNIRILGNTAADRLAIVSFGIHHGRGLLHGNFVTAVLNDLFGIQARSGCFCAGPYIHRTYPIDDVWSEQMGAEVSRGHVGAKLSFTRLGFNYFTSKTVFDYVLQAVHLVADQGWRLLPQYRFDPASGLWSHVRRAARRRVSLADVSFGSDGPIGGDGVAVVESEDVLSGYLEEARLILWGADPVPGDGPNPELSPEFERIRWFPLPGEATPSSQAGRAARPGRASSILDRSWIEEPAPAEAWRSGRSA